MAALLFKVDYAWQHGLTRGCRAPCTSEQNMWAVPSLTDVEPMQAADMIVKKPKLRASSTRRTSMRESSAARKLFSTSRSRHDAEPFTVADIANAVYPDCSDGVVFNYCFESSAVNYEPYSDVNVALCVECTAVDTKVLPLSMLLCATRFSDESDFQLPVYAQSDIQALEEATRGQAQNDMWHSMHKGRISASVAHSVYTRTNSLLQGKSHNVDALLDIIFRRKPNLPLAPLQYGVHCEPEAIATYVVSHFCDHINLRVTQCGLFLYQNAPFLCASPDAIVECDCCGSGLLEVKCPFKSASCNPSECDLPYMLKCNDQLLLKKSHQYYRGRKRKWNY